jgi:hypothetical protein
MPGFGVFASSGRTRGLPGFASLRRSTARSTSRTSCSCSTEPAAATTMFDGV